MAEMRPLAFSMFTIFFFFILTSLISPNLLIYSESYGLITPETYQGAELGNYQFVYNVTVDDSTFTQFQALQLHNFELGGQYWTLFIDSGYNYLRLGRRNYFGIFLISYDYLTFRHELGSDRGDVLTKDEMNLDFSEDVDWIKYRMYNPSDAGVGCEINLGFNRSEFNTPYEAFENEELVVYVGMGIDNLYSTLNAWQLITLVMFFQLPNIDPLTNALIAFPLWFFFCLPVVLFILKFIPFVGD